MSKVYAVWDLETSGTTTYKRFCNPLDQRHSVTLNAYKIQGKPANVVFNTNNYAEGIAREDILKALPLHDIKFLAGQNIKFDLLWVWGTETFQNWLKAGGKVWDTQTVEYLLTGQRSGKRDLDTLAVTYGAQVKDDRVKVMFQAGMQSKDIPKEILIPYAEGDVLNTEKVLQGQAKKATALEMMPIIDVYMEHYLAVTEMEYNGMFLDKAKAWEWHDKLHKEVGELEKTLAKLTAPLLQGSWAFNPGSLEHVSAILFGGTVTTVERVQLRDEDGSLQVYKTGAKQGEIKSRMEKVSIETTGYKLKPQRQWQKAKGHFGSDDNVLTELLERSLSADARQFIEAMLHYRKQKKLLTTYFFSEEYYKSTGELKKTTGLIPLVSDETGCIHTEYKTAYTTTGRLASSNPNVQNLPPEILDIFCSRWKDDGVILEIDYSQLEVRVQAALTNSTNMINDIINGVDFHALRLAYAEDLSYEEVVAKIATSAEWRLKRKRAKTVSFQKAYGAGPEKIAESSGLSVEVVKKIFQKEDEAYPEIEAFYKKIEEEILQTRVCTTELIKIRDKARGIYFEKEGEYGAYAFFTSATKKRYAFEEKATVTRNNKIFRYFSRPDIQDYPVQGLAADIVASQVGKVFRTLIHHRDKALLINEVHDSLILDVKKEHLDWTIKTVCGILEAVAETFKEKFGMEIPVPITVDYSFGATWKGAKESD